MRLEILTLALDAMPWITHHATQLNALPERYPWRWTVAHGVSANVADTKWIKAQLPRLSNDGTTEYLDSLSRNHPRMRVLTKKLWMGKTAQINACLEGVETPAIILQMDADECWSTEQLIQIVDLFEARPDIDIMQFRCNYFLGGNIVASREGSYGCRQNEWTRAWRMNIASERFVTHEPPNFGGNIGGLLSRNETAEFGLTFNHHSYATERQVAYKELVYKYPGAVAGWRRLQANTQWPTKLKQFLPWVDADAEADLLVR